MKNIKQLHILIFFLIAVVLFLNAGKGEVQPWDEGLYAYRAVGISHSGNYIDQTKESLAGLYSSTSPPFTMWMIFASTKLFGENLMAIRAFTLLCSVLSIILVFYISQFFISYNKSIMVSILLSSAILWNTYSRQAMTDIPLITMFLLLLFIIIKYYGSGKKHQIFIYSTLFGLIFAITILTKIAISLFPLLFVFIYIFSPQKISKKIVIAISAIIGIAIASPWYIYMSSIYGAEFYNALLLPHITTAVENNSRQSGVLYYINGLLVSCPLIIFIFLKQKKQLKLKDIFKYKSRKMFIFLSILVWFCIMFLLMTLSETKMPHYTNYILVPAIILAMYNADNVRNETLSSKSYYFWILSTFIAFFWSFSFDFRQDLKLISKFQFTESSIIFMGIIIVSVLAYKLAAKDKIRKLGKRFMTDGIVVLSVILMSRIFFLNLTEPTGMSFGAEYIVKKAKTMAMDTIVYVFHNYANTDSLNPQLEWYLYENYKTMPKPFIIKYALAKNKFELERVMALDSLKNYPLIYNIPDKSPQVKENITEISKSRKIISGSGNYLLFTKKTKNRSNGLQL
jgi:4-amino-4-deoxy-L-arabinose transferase-like glycosyltransferase